MRTPTGTPTPCFRTSGLEDAYLIGRIVKKRIGLAGRGKREGARTRVATNKGHRWFLVFGFEKNERNSFSDNELEALQDLASSMLGPSASQLETVVRNGALHEVAP